MSFFIENWALILMALTSGGLLLAPQLLGAGGSQAVSTSEAVRLLNREKGVLIDISEPADYNAGHPIGARNVPVASLESSKELPSNKALPLIVMCATGARSGRAAATLRKMGFEKVHAVSGGKAAWREANLPVEKNAA